MLDLQRLRRETTAVASQLRRRGYEFDVTVFIELESERKDLQSTQQALQSERNRSSREIGKLKEGSEDSSDLLARMQEVNNELIKFFF